MSQQQYLNEVQSQLQSLSSDELKELLNDDGKLEEKVDTMLKHLEDEKEVILNENRAIAEESLSKEPEVLSKRSRVNELSEQAKSLCTNVQEKLTEIKNKSANSNRDTVLALLQTAAAESEENSDSLVKQLLEKELTIDEFLEQFLALRRTMHLRKIKSEKMAELLRQQQQQHHHGPGYPTNSNFYPSNVYPGQPGGNAMPYPMGPIQGMPMPGNMFRPY